MHRRAVFTGRVPVWLLYVFESPSPRPTAAIASPKVLDRYGGQSWGADLRWNTPPIGQAITRIESLTQRNVVNAQQTADGASEMTTQMESTRKFLDELVAVVGLESA